MSGRKVVRYVAPDTAVTQELPIVQEHAAAEEQPARRRRGRAWVVAPLLAIVIPLAVGLAWAQRGDDHGAPARDSQTQLASVEPVPHAGDPQEQARELSTWLRTHSR